MAVAGAAHLDRLDVADCDDLAAAHVEAGNQGLLLGRAAEDFVNPFVEDHFVCLFVAMPVLCSQMDAVSSTVTFLLDSVGLHHRVEGWDAEQ